jgi:hypothetical protein
MSINSLIFDGSSNYGDCGNAASLQLTSGPISVFIFAKSNAPGSGYRDMLTKNTNYGFGAYNNSTFYVYDWSTNTRYDSSNNPWNGNWNGLGAVLNPGVTNGSQLYSFGSGMANGADGPAFTIGSNTSTLYHLLMANTDTSGTPTPAGEWFAGQETYLAVIPAALTATQMAQIAAGISPSIFGPAAFYKCTDGSGTTVTDFSGNGNNAILVGGVTWSTDIPAVLGIAVSPTAIPANHSGNITLTLTRQVSGFVNGTTVLTPSGVSGVTKVSQSISSGTSATVVVTTSAGTGTLTITESVTGSNTAALLVETATLLVSPSGALPGSVLSVTITGTNTVWTQETASTLFSVTGGTGSSLASTTVLTDTAATATLTVGTADAVLTITDASTGAQASFIVGPIFYIRADNVDGMGSLPSNDPNTTTWVDLIGGVNGTLNSFPTNGNAQDGWSNFNTPTAPCWLFSNPNYANTVTFGNINGGVFPSTGSLEFWYSPYINDGSTTHRNLLTTSDLSTNPNNCIRFEQESGTPNGLSAIIENGSNTSDIPLGPNSSVLGADTQAVLTWDTGTNTVDVYVNGQVVSTGNSNTYWPTSPFDLLLFAGHDIGRLWYGYLRILRIYTAQLTAVQVITNWIADAHPVVETTVGTQASYTPPIVNSDTWTCSNPDWADTSGAGVGPWVYTPQLQDGGTITTVPFVSGNGYGTLNVNFVCQRNYSALVQVTALGSPAIVASTPWTKPEQNIGGTYYSLNQNEALTAIDIYTSTDLENWTLSGSSPAFSVVPSTWFDQYPVHPNVVKVGSTYYCFCMGRDASNNAGIGYWTSTDELVWTPYASNPVLTGYAVPGVWVYGTGLSMLAAANSLTEPYFNLFTSTNNGNSWYSQGTVLPINSGDWDAAFASVEDPFIVPNGTTNFEMVYTAFTGNTSTSPVQALGAALTLEGYTWFKGPAAVINLGTTNYWAGDPCQIVKGNTLYLLFDVTPGSAPYDSYGGAYVATMLAHGIQPDAVSNSYNASVTSLTQAHTWSGPNRSLEVQFEFLTSGSVSGTPQYGGANMTFIGAQNVTGGIGRIEFWGICQGDSGAPDAGQNNITANFSGTVTCTCTAASYVGVLQSSPREAFTSNYGSSGTSQSLTVTTLTANVWVVAGIMTATASGVAAGQTSRNVVDGAAGTGANEDTGPVGTPGATAMTFTGLGSTAARAMGGYGLKPTTNSNNYVATVSDSPSTTDSVTRGQMLVRSVAETPSTSDATARVQTLARALTAAPATTDTVARVQVLARSLTDAPATSDAATRFVAAVRSVTEAPSTSDSATRVLVMARSATETPVTTDTPERIFVGARSATETPSTTDSLSAAIVITRSVTETPSTADSVARVQVLARTLADAPATTDTATRVGAFARATTESPQTTDTATRLYVASRNLSDTPATTDAASRFFVGARDLIDSPTTTDSVTATKSGSTTGAYYFRLYVLSRRG